MPLSPMTYLLLMVNTVLGFECAGFLLGMFSKVVDQLTQILH